MNFSKIIFLSIIALNFTFLNATHAQFDSPAIAAAEKAFPPCPGEYNSTTWNNCFGAHKNEKNAYYIGEYQKGKRSGIGLIEYSNGDKYIGEWKNGLFDGKGVYVWKNGDKHVGTFGGDQTDGAGIWYLSNRQIQESGIWHQGQLNQNIRIDESVFPFSQDVSFQKFLDIYKKSADFAIKTASEGKQIKPTQKKASEKFCFGGTSKYTPESCQIDDIRADGWYGQIMLSEFLDNNKIKKVIYTNERNRAMYPGTIDDVTVIENFERNGNKFKETSSSGCSTYGEISETSNEITINKISMDGAGCAPAVRRLFELYKGPIKYKKISY